MKSTFFAALAVFLITAITTATAGTIGAGESPSATPTVAADGVADATPEARQATFVACMIKAGFKAGANFRTRLNRGPDGVAVGFGAQIDRAVVPTMSANICADGVNLPPF